ncbi:MAG: DUF4296 domain-containing protein [Bacteroidales bacterium]|nr:DUF4296 domain-containing protein [Bacteroidales bacterium]
MKRCWAYLLPALLLLACSSRVKIIPRGEMAEIYADIFLVDQWASDRGLPRRQMDTLSLYGAVLERYGYTVADFNASEEKYLRDPERFSRIIKKSMAMLDQREVVLKQRMKEQLSEKDRQKARLVYAPYERFRMGSLDSLGVFRLPGDIRVYVDTTVYSSWNLLQDE